ncbi:MAG: DUF4114 domain-containing protein [Pseudomonadota bacterium]
MRTSTLAIVFSLILLSFGSHAQAGPILDEVDLDTYILGGSFFVVEDGIVEAEFLGSDAGYFNSLYLVDSATDTGSFVFDKSTERESTLSLGSFTAGTELIFRLDVRNTGYSFFSGSTIPNPDGLAHALAITTLLDGIYLTTVGFEDLYGGGDEDYNDFMFSLTNVVDPELPSDQAVPTPSVLLLMLAGLTTLCLQRRRRLFSLS